MDFLNHVSENISKYKNKKILLGLSGGADSVSLFLVLKKLKINFTCAHLNHGIRSASDLDQIFCEELCKKHGIKLFSKKIEPEKNSEEYLREERHKFLKQVQKEEKLDLIALAHNKDDFIEQILLFIFRGIGDMNIKKRYKSFDGNFLRPLHSIFRKEILIFLEKEDQIFKEDETNLDAKYTRNFLRNDIIPKLNKKFPDFEKVLFRNLEIISANSDFVSEKTDKFLEKNLKKDTLNLKKFLNQKKAIKFSIAKKLFKDETSYARIQELVYFLENGKSGGKKDLGGNFEILKSRHEAKIQSKKRFVIKKKKLKIGKNFFGMYKIVVRKANKIQPGILYLKDEEIYLRTWKEGDRFTPKGMKGKKKLQDFFVDKKIPVFLRSTYPIFVDRKDKILAVGDRVSENSLIKNEKEFLEIEIRYL